MAITVGDGLWDVQAFAGWLAAHFSDAPVGRACDTEHCPLACWLSDVYGGRWSVGPIFYTCIDDTAQSGGLPWWAHLFSGMIDNRFDGLVSASNAYAVLLDLVPVLRDGWREG